MDRDPLLVERQKTHGSFEVHARITQDLKDKLHDESDGWAKLNDQHRESLEMIMHKVGRIIAGDANFKDHWHDISGYALLGMEACDE